MLTETQLRHDEEQREQQLGSFLHGSVIQTASKLHLQRLIKTLSSQNALASAPQLFSSMKFVTDSSVKNSDISLLPFVRLFCLNLNRQFLHKEHLDERVRVSARCFEARASSVYTSNMFTPKAV